MHDYCFYFSLFSVISFWAILPTSHIWQFRLFTRIRLELQRCFDGGYGSQVNGLALLDAIASTELEQRNMSFVAFDAPISRMGKTLFKLYYRITGYYKNPVRIVSCFRSHMVVTEGSVLDGNVAVFS